MQFENLKKGAFGITGIIEKDFHLFMAFKACYLINRDLLVLS